VSTRSRSAALLAVVLFGAGCGAQVEKTQQRPPPRTPVWARSTPVAEHIDPEVVAEADRLARTKLSGVTSLLVARHSRLVVERYYEGQRASDAFPVFSITKTFVSCLVGIALADGHLRSVDEQLREILPQTRSRITLRQLLTMTAGFGRGLNLQTTDPVELASRPLVNLPGTTFNYDSGSSDLLAAVLEQATGEPIGEYAEQHLFRPIGIRAAHWPASKGGSGLVLRPRELLAFGQLYLDGGSWHGKRILSRAWVRDSTRSHVDVSLGKGLTAGYGYNWWIDRRRPRTVVAHGYLGQALTVFPTRNTVVAVTSSSEKQETGYTLARVISRGLH
jgi:CubicO group peptidase (beta-lactamase class C family)